MKCLPKLMVPDVSHKTDLYSQYENFQEFFCEVVLHQYKFKKSSVQSILSLPVKSQIRSYYNILCLYIPQMETMTIATWENYKEKVKDQFSKFWPHPVNIFRFAPFIALHLIYLPITAAHSWTTTSTSATCCTRFPAKKSAEPGLFQVREVTAMFKSSTCMQRLKEVGKEQMLCSLSSFRWSLMTGSLWRCEQDSWLSSLSHTRCTQVLASLAPLRNEGGERESPYQTDNCLGRHLLD